MACTAYLHLHGILNPVAQDAATTLMVALPLELRVPVRVFTYGNGGLLEFLVDDKRVVEHNH